jgi:hypothetical protein
VPIINEDNRGAIYTSAADFKYTRKIESRTLAITLCVAFLSYVESKHGTAGQWAEFRGQTRYFWTYHDTGKMCIQNTHALVLALVYLCEVGSEVIHHGFKLVRTIAI